MDKEGNDIRNGIYLPQGELVAVTLRFTTREYNGQVYQDILVTDIEKLGK